MKYGKFQVWDAWWYWNQDPFQANIIKYVMRVKGDVTKRLEDLEKAEHYLQKYKELLTEQLNTFESQHEEANESSWQLTPLQDAIVRGIAFNHLREQIVQLGMVEDLMKTYKEQLKAEKNEGEQA